MTSEQVSSESQSTGEGGVLGVVTLYKPDEKVTENIMSYAPWLDALVIWDNTPGGAANVTLPPDIERKVVAWRKGDNVGIGQGLNFACRHMAEHGYSYLLTMDQDSRFEKGSFAAYLNAIHDYKKREDGGKAWAFIPRINSMPGAEATAESESNLQVSGTVFVAECFEKIGEFREEYVMDAIDTEYALRILKSGHTIKRVREGNLLHSLGSPKRGHFLWMHPVTLNYSPVRTYYIVRNHISLSHEYKGAINAYVMRKLVWQRPLYILLMERDKAAKLKAWWLGFWQGTRDRMTPDHYFDKLRRG